MSTDRVSVHVGRTDLNQTSDRVHIHTVSELIVHPNYHRYALPNDVALIKLAKNITMMDHIQPVCLWSVDKGLTQDWALENRGILAGFGTTELAVLSNHLREVDVRIVDLRTCIESDREIYGKHLTRNMLCGKANVCVGDAGAGVMLVKDGIWYIRGVLLFVSSIDGHLCDNSKYAVFTDVPRYHDWISQSVDLTYVK
ncbi:chymotrypsin-like protease CTRL-1 [Anopheles ziemanni]|uniref:chymotrypsin-like protease CTRL-1 n=1 Tax=Anopheles ziemanni TaxID=345580 RepID=UPI0026605635|nr:chymotrypsin-like protease CTRL-1 [Anopheles ziemanni]